MKTTLIIFASIFLTLSTAVGQTGKISGVLIDSINNEGFMFASIKILNTDYMTVSDSSGSFSIDSIPAGAYEIKISSIGLPDMTIETVKVESNLATTLSINYPPLCEYSKNGKKCPICEKVDKVYEYKMGITVNDSVKRILYLGCIARYCRPRWYCERDSIDYGTLKE